MLRGRKGLVAAAMAVATLNPGPEADKVAEQSGSQLNMEACLTLGGISHVLDPERLEVSVPGGGVQLINPDNLDAAAGILGGLTTEEDGERFGTDSVASHLEDAAEAIRVAQDAGLVPPQKSEDAEMAVAEARAAVYSAWNEGCGFTFRPDI